MTERYKPTVEDRRHGGETLNAALRQCGISVRWAIAGPQETFDVMGVFMGSKWFAEWLNDQLAEAWKRGLNTGMGYSVAVRALGPDATDPENPYRPEES